MTAGDTLGLRIARHLNLFFGADLIINWPATQKKSECINASINFLLQSKNNIFLQMHALLRNEWEI